MKNISILLAFLMTLSAPVAAQDFDKGLAAYDASDWATALQEWKPLAEQGSASAQFNLALMYSNGRGVLQDYKEAVKWYTLAAEQGYARAQFLLAINYYVGEGVLQDYEEAVKWYTLAAEQGHVQAQFHLGSRYALGRGALQDNIMAHMWINIASANGYEGSGSTRDQIAKKMTPAAIEKAQAMARECMSSDYKKCGY
jgi:TPR repeat protein